MSNPFPTKSKLTCARYSKKSMGIGSPGDNGTDGAAWFFKTEGRDLDDDDVAVLHRMIHLWNAARKLTIEEAVSALAKGGPQ